MQLHFIFFLLSVTSLCVSAAPYAFKESVEDLGQTRNTTLSARGGTSANTPTVKWTIGKLKIASDTNRHVAPNNRKDLFTFTLQNNLAKSEPSSYIVAIPTAQHLANPHSTLTTMDLPSMTSVVVPHILAVKHMDVSIDDTKEVEFSSTNKNDKMIINVKFAIRARKPSEQDYTPEPQVVQFISLCCSN